MKTIEYVSNFVIRPTANGHQVLLGRRAEGRYMGGTWQLITGSIEPNETAWQAAAREIAEETGLVVRDLYRLPYVTQFYRVDADAICVAPMFCALVPAKSEATINPEHTHLEWMDLDAAADRLMWPGDLIALDQARRLILGEHPAKSHLRVPLP